MWTHTYTQAFIPERNQASRRLSLLPLQLPLSRRLCWTEAPLLFFFKYPWERTNIFLFSRRRQMCQRATGLNSGQKGGWTFHCTQVESAAMMRWVTVKYCNFLILDWVLQAKQKDLTHHTNLGNNFMLNFICYDAKRIHKRGRHGALWLAKPFRRSLKSSFWENWLSMDIKTA